MPRITGFIIAAVAVIFTLANRSLTKQDWSLCISSIIPMYTHLKQLLG